MSSLLGGEEREGLRMGRDQHQLIRRNWEIGIRCRKLQAGVLDFEHALLSHAGSICVTRMCQDLDGTWEPFSIFKQKCGFARAVFSLMTQICCRGWIGGR